MGEGRGVVPWSITGERLVEGREVVPWGITEEYSFGRGARGSTMQCY